MPEWSNGAASRAVGLVPTQVRTLFPAVEMKVLINEDGKVYFCSNKEFHSKDGIVKVKNGAVKSKLGKKFYIFDAKFSDLVHKLKRGPAIILKRDVGSILAYTGVNSKSKVLDAGVGGGFLCSFLANVCDNVVGYERDERFFKLAKENFTFLGLKVKLYKKDVHKGISEKNLDLITLDLLEPWKVLKHAHKSLKSGGFLVCYVPQITQVMKVVENVKDKFVVEKIIENTEREWIVKGRVVRPEHMGLLHTGFLVFLRRI